MKRLLVLLALLAAAAPAAHAAALGLNAASMSDSDGFNVRKVSTELAADGENGVRLSRSTYDDGHQALDTVALEGFVRRRVGTRWELKGSAGVLSYPGRSLFIGDGNAVYAPGGDFRLETFLEQGVVDSMQGLSRALGVTTVGAAADIPVSKHVLAVGGADLRGFGDGNLRRGYVAKVIYLTPRDGLSLQVWQRQFWSGKDDAAGYFNPKTMSSQKIVVSLRRRMFTATRFVLIAGPGLQKVDTEETTGTWYTDAAVETRINGDLVCRLKYLYSDSAFESAYSSYRLHMISGGVSWLF